MGFGCRGPRYSLYIYIYICTTPTQVGFGCTSGGAGHELPGPAPCRADPLAAGGEGRPSPSRHFAPNRSQRGNPSPNPRVSFRRLGQIGHPKRAQTIPKSFETSQEASGLGMPVNPTLVFTISCRAGKSKFSKHLKISQNISETPNNLNYLRTASFGSKEKHLNRSDCVPKLSEIFSVGMR